MNDDLKVPFITMQANVTNITIVKWAAYSGA